RSESKDPVILSERSESKDPVILSERSESKDPVILSERSESKDPVILSERSESKDPVILSERSESKDLHHRMPPTSLPDVRASVRALGNEERAVGAARFFKTGPGDYGEGDEFLGIRVPDLRRIARASRTLSRSNTLKLLRSPWHEERLVALLILVEAHKRAAASEQLELHRAYLANTAYVNNWDLVDSSAEELVGAHIPSLGGRLLQRLAKSPSLWERRISIVATFWTIKHHDFSPTLVIAERLMRDEQDLIHKAMGWMLREVGKRDVTVLRRFLGAHAPSMPRVALRYAIERFDDAERRRYLGA
ncbi:MAG: DNA alkylation repair protein, partial [bacterium]